MSDVSTEFVLLRQSVTAESQLVTRTLSTHVPAGPILVAIDQHDHKHLLVPLADGETVTSDTRSRGVWLTQTPLGASGNRQLFADLECRDLGLDLVFERLVEDVLARITAGEVPGVALHTALDDWRAMLRAGRAVGREDIIGLIGELEVLRILGRPSPAAALRAWTGPKKTVHDFVRPEAAIEVKATSAVDGASVTIHGLDQVDPAEVGELHLVVLHCILDPAAPTLDERIRRLIRLDFPRDELLAGISRTGYAFEAETGEPSNYRVKSFRVWPIDESFPGLRRSALPENVRRGVTQVRYTLSLDSAKPCLAESEGQKFLEDWVTP